MRSSLAFALLLLAACDGDDRPTRPPSSGWAIGAPDARSTPSTFTIPTSGSINYITKATGSLAGKTRITLRYRIDMAEGVQIVPSSVPEQASMITLYVQREGDDWSGQGEMNFYRWYATSNYQSPITAGEHTLTASLTDKWTAINYGDNGPMGAVDSFNDALRNAGRVGFVLGGGTGFGHGVKATGPATFTIISFSIE